jgi:hypothetical protein
MVSNKGQGLSLTTIIVAALALIVLVVLVMVFTGRIGSFEKGLSDEGKVELVKMRIQYDDCRPTSSSELRFDIALSAAENVESEATAKTEFLDEIDRCGGFSNDKAVCESNGCKWS